MIAVALALALQDGTADGATLRQLVEDVQRQTRRTFLCEGAIDAQLRQRKLHIFAGARPRTPEEYFALLQNVLQINRLVLVPAGDDLYKILAPGEAPGPVAGGAPERTDAYVTRLFRLQYVGAREAQAAITPLARGAVIVAVESSGALIASDFDANLKRLGELLRELDVPKPDVLLKRIPLKHALAGDVEQMLTIMARRAPSGVPGLPAPETVRIASDKRTNALVVYADPVRMKQIEELVSELDGESSFETIGVYPRRLRHASAEDVAKTLNLLYAQGGVRPGQVAAPGAAPPERDDRRPTIVADPGTNSLLVSADRLTAERILRLADQLDERRAQVHIQATVVEVRDSDHFDLGVELSRIVDPEGRIALVGRSAHGLSRLTPAGDIVPAESTGLTLALLSDRIGNIGLLLKALQATGKVDVIDVPEAATVDHGAATMTAATEVPVARTTFTGPQGTPVQSFELEKAETTLTISPHISEGGYLRLDTVVKVQKFLGATIPGAPPARSTRSIDTKSILVPDGRTVVIGGIVTRDATESESKVPFFGDIPLLGWFFRRTERRQEKVTLYIFITPRIMYDEAFGDFADLTRERTSRVDRLRGRELGLPVDGHGGLLPITTFRHRGPADR